MTISKYIEQDLESRIRSGNELPEKFTLSAIADLYDVSPTPVRLALEALIKKKLIVKQDNGRLVLGEGLKSRRKFDPPSKPVDWEAVLANEILIQSLTRQEGFLREETMAEKHGIGRALLRRVFHRLAGGGLIEHIPRRGWRVRTFRKEDMDAFIVIRETLEVKALELAQPFLITEDLERMAEGNSEVRARESLIDNDLHAYFIEKSNNRYIASFFETHGGYYTAMFDYATLGAEVVVEMAAQHREILSHAIAGQWDLASRALSNHIRSQKPVMEKMIAMLEEEAES